KERWYAIGDVRVELETIAAEPAAPAAEPQIIQARVPLSRLVIPAALALIAGVVLGGGVYRYWNLKFSAPPARARFFVLPAEKTTFYTGGRIGASGAISPDGRKLAFTAADSSGKVTLWLRFIDSLTAQPVPGTEGASFPFWSPESRFIAYFANDKVFR